MSESATIIHREVNVVTQDEWITLNPSIKDAAIKIANSIEAAHNKIERATKLAKEALDKKGGFLGIGKQKSVNTALANSQVITNEAMVDLSEIIQQSIRFTLQSVKTASDMQKALAYVAVNGVRDTNGRIETLSTECAESIDAIIDSAHDFLQQQAEFSEQIEAQEAKAKEQDRTLDGMEKALQWFSENIDRHGQRLSDLQKHIDKNETEQEQHRENLELLVEKNISSIVYIQETISANQIKNDERFLEYENTFRKLIDSNRKFDEEERNRLRDDYYSDVKKMKMIQIITSCSIGVIAVTALIISII